MQAAMRAVAGEGQWYHRFLLLPGPVGGGGSGAGMEGGGAISTETLATGETVDVVMTGITVDVVRVRVLIDQD